MKASPVRRRLPDLPVKRPLLMGIVNLTPDSFSDGGCYQEPEKALAHGRRLLEEGAHLLDLGAESTRPGAEPVEAAEEWARLEPVLAGLRATDAILSVDSCKWEVQERAIAAGVPMINDVFGGSEPLFEVAASEGVALVLMHCPASPQVMQQHAEYEDVVECLLRYFDERRACCARYGLEEVWMDPGIGFGKKLEHNLAILRALPRFRAAGHRLLLGVSRKSWIDHLCGAPVERRLAGSLTAALHAARAGVDILRVHDVLETAQALAVEEALHHG